MSAALTLPYVWATATEERSPRRNTELPAGEIAFYRKRTEALLRRYLQASLAVGRVPSVAGDVTMRGRATNFRLKNFEDVVIFVIDVESCLKVLEPEPLRVVVKIALQEYMLMEVADELGQDVWRISRIYGRALDSLTAVFLKKGLLQEKN